MAHRLGLFLVLALSVILAGVTVGVAGPRFEAVFRQLPGGMEGLPGFTRAFLAASRWSNLLWPLLVVLLAALLFGVPRLLRRTEAGRRRVARFDDLLERGAPVLYALYFVFLGSVLYAVALTLFLPLLRIIDALTSAG